MKKKFFSFFKMWPFWIGLQATLIILLNIIGHMRAENNLHDILLKPGMAVIGFFITVLGFPSGIYFFYNDGSKAHTGSLWTLFVLILPFVYYPLSFFLIRYIQKEKRHWRWIAIGLLAFILLSFGGCSKTVNIPLYFT